MKEQFVTYEIALKLKEKGFNEPCLANYCDKDLIPYRGYPDEGDEDSNFSTTVNENKTSLWASAPLWQQVIDWLRTEHNIYLWVYKYYDDEVEKDLYRFDMKNGGFYSSFYNTSEEARQAAIEHALTLI